MSLHPLGWTPRLESAFAPHRALGLEPARVAREDRERYLLLDAAGERPAVLAGRLRHEARGRLDLPAVGDWVAVRPGDRATIVAVLPRSSAFVRKVAGLVTEEQVVAANVDAVFLVTGLDHDFNPRRLERYLAVAWESGASPVVVLNKSDLAADLEARLDEAASVAVGSPVVALSAIEASGLEALDPWLEPGRTVALLGSSGAGKSTLLNALMGADRQATTAVRDGDSRGRHTTTARELFVLPRGSLVLDTPGMRELALWSGDEKLPDAFPEIADLASGCRFRDCRHQTEPGCAVRDALERGTLDPDRFASWSKLQRELRWIAAQRDVRLRAEEQARWKAIHKSMKHHPKAKRWR